MPAGVRNLCLSVPGPRMEDALRLLRGVGPGADMVELRLDLIRDYDLPTLLAACERPAVVTFRPSREGGAYDGDEAFRLAELRRAARLGAAWVDVELDACAAVGPLAPAGKLVSHHVFEPSPVDPAALVRRLEETDADAIKLACQVQTPAQAGRLLALFRQTPRLAVLLAMGEAGIASRVLCLRFDNCLLTYVAGGQGQATAPGQFSLEELQRDIPARAVGSRTVAIGLVGTRGELALAGPVNAELARRGADAVCVPLGTLDLSEAAEAVPALHLAGALVGAELEQRALDAVPSATDAARRIGRANILLNSSGTVVGDYRAGLGDCLTSLLGDPGAGVSGA